MSHTCHHPTCDKPIPPSLLACRGHWYALRGELREAIWREYRAGQEVDKRPSLRYLAIQQLACAEWTFRPGDKAAMEGSALYLLNAQRWRARAIVAGHGDPFVRVHASAPELALATSQTDEES